MAKLLADRLLSQISRDEHIRAAQDRLKLPAQNHAPMDDPHRMLFDRFVLDPDDVSQMIADMGGKGLPIGPVPLPLPLFWLERGSFGLLVDGERATIFAVAVGQFYSIGMIEVRGAHIPDPPRLQLTEGARQFLLAAGESPDADELLSAIFDAMCTAVLVCCQHRVVSTRRVLPKSDPAFAAMRRRAMQKGVPWCSYNVVTLRRPETSEFRGQIINDRPRGTVRAHQRSGAWRLISLHRNERGELDPYWTWVEGGEVGNRAAGYVQKTRRVKPKKGTRTRKGYVVPEDEGRPGERRKAVRK